MELELKSKVHRFGGRLDAMGFDGQGRLVVIDFKTNDKYYDDMKYQLAGYAILWDENYPDTPITGGAHLCRFDKKDSGFSHHMFPGPDLAEAKEFFLEMREMYPKLLSKLDGKK
jgi:hypothetical protein